MGGGAGGGRFGNTAGGRANAKIQQDRQDKHIEGTKNYNQQIANGKNPSILTANAEELLREGTGRGISYGNREVVEYGKGIGRFYDERSGQYYETTKATIHYDGKGNAHIVPAKPNWLISN